MPTSLSAKIPKLRLRPKEPEIRLDLTGHLTGVGACRRDTDPRLLKWAELLLALGRLAEALDGVVCLFVCFVVRVFRFFFPRVVRVGKALERGAAPDHGPLAADELQAWQDQLELAHAARV